MNIYLLRLGVFFYPLLLSFHFQITYKKVRSLQIGVDKIVRKVSINLLPDPKSAACIISIIIIIDTPAAANWFLHKIF